MRTSFDLPDPLLKQAKKLAHERQASLRDLVEEGLRLVLAQRKQPAKPFVMPDCSVGGDGLVDGLDWGDWDKIRDIIYEGR